MVASSAALSKSHCSIGWLDPIPCKRCPPRPPLQHREFDAVHRVRAVEKSLLRFLLKPELLSPIGQYYENPVSRKGLRLQFKLAQ